MTTSAEQPAAALASRQRLPDFFIVGHHKCGTTALYEMLRRHPQIYMPELKEPRFFASDLRYRPTGRAGGRATERATGRVAEHAARETAGRAGERATGETAGWATGDPQTLEEYLSLFAAAAPEQRVGEASPLYLWSRTAAGRIAEVAPDARIIAILREPASFLRSLHLHWLLHHIETEKDFRKAISLEQDRREGRQVPRSSYWPQALLYSDQVRYVEQLRRYHALFAPEQVLVLIYDDFRQDNEATVRRVLRFLDVDSTSPIEVIEANQTKARVRARRLDALIRTLYVGQGPVSRTVKAGVKTLTPQRLRRDAVRVTRRHVVYGSPRPPDERFMLELRRRFKPEVVALSEYLDRDLVALWGYDKLG